MKMYDTLLVCLYNISGKKESLGDILAHLACHVITLYAVYCRVLVRVLLLDLFVIALKKA